jgi:hypothetical protein
VQRRVMLAGAHWRFQLATVAKHLCNTALLRMSRHETTVIHCCVPTDFCCVILCSPTLS